MNPRIRRPGRPVLDAVVALAALLLASGCGSSGSAGSATPASTRSSDPTISSTVPAWPSGAAPPVVLRVWRSGGFAGTELPPQSTVYGDGLVATAATATLVPEFRLFRLTSAGLGLVMAKARAAGLAKAAGTGSAPSPDSSVTRVRLVDRGTVYQRDLVAGGDAAAYAFVTALREPARLAGATEVTGPVGVSPHAIALRVAQYDGTDPSQARRRAVAWDVADVALAPAGCRVVSGAAIAAVADVFARHQSQVLWSAGATVFVVTARALLPDEHSC